MKILSVLCMICLLLLMSKNLWFADTPAMASHIYLAAALLGGSLNWGDN